LFCQSGPAEDILEPGRACGMPYAPLGLAACTFQPLSWSHMVSSESQQPPQPRWALSCLAYPLLVSADGLRLIRRFSAAAARSRASSLARSLARLSLARLTACSCR